jgi:hypothetical protein
MNKSDCDNKDFPGDCAHFDSYVQAYLNDWELNNYKLF